ncbi:MAG: phosphoribosylglycinamide formyltransferase [Desulfobacterales bacterium]|nr:phosphoribosylglycinamide formyltransferase [Desulfobacterales bacterium]
MKNIRIGVFISGTGTNFQAVIDECKNENIPGNIVFVGTDNPLAKGIDRAKKNGIPYFIVDYDSIIQGFDKNQYQLPEDFNLDEIISKQTIFPKNYDRNKVEKFFKTRAIAEYELIKNMNEYPFDLLVLAGFMRNISPYFIDKISPDPLNPKIMNIHPALLPAFAGTDGYGDTFRYGCKIGGCTVHFIDYGSDSGPIIGQSSFPITEDDTLESIKEKGLKIEWKLYPECIKLFAEKKIKVVNMTYNNASNEKIFQKKIVKIVSDMF